MACTDDSRAPQTSLCLWTEWLQIIRTNTQIIATRSGIQHRFVGDETQCQYFHAAMPCYNNLWHGRHSYKIRTQAMQQTALCPCFVARLSQPQAALPSRSSSLPWASNKRISSFVQASCILRPSAHMLPNAVYAPSQVYIIRIGQSWEAGSKVVYIWSAERVYARKTSQIYVLVMCELILGVFD